MFRQEGSRGFTLLELLVGMTIFVLIAGTAYSALRSATRIWETVDAQSRADGEARHALEYLRRQVSTAFPLAIPTEDGWRLWFKGESDRIVFLVEGSRHVGLSGLYQMIVYHNTQADRPSVDLVLQYVDERLQIGEVRAHALRWVLIEDIEEVEFAYFGAHDQDDEPIWYSQWRNLQVPPKLVRLRVQGGAIGRWPTLTMRLPVEEMSYFLERHEKLEPLPNRLDP